MDTFNVDNMKKVIVVGAKIGGIAGKMFEDGKISAADLSLLPEFLMTFPLLVDIQWGQIVPEAKDLNQEEINELVTAFCDAFDIPQDKIEITIESVLSVITQIVSLIFNLINIFKKPAV